MPGHEVDARLGQPGRPGQPQDAVLDQVDLRHVGVAQLAGTVHHGAEDRVHVRGRPADRGEHVAGRGKLVRHLGELGSQACVFLA
jgi:hypothetical protein